MTIWQFLRVVWARRWLFLSLFLLVSAGGIGYVLSQPKLYESEVSVLIDVKSDPLLGLMAPGLAQPASMATQAELVRSDRVASRVVKILGVDRSEAAVQQWRQETGAAIPIERHYAELLLMGLQVTPSRGTNFMTITYTAQDPKFAAAAANAFAQAYMEVSVDMRVEPARQYATWFDQQSNTLRSDLERAQAKLSRYQQEKGITDEKLEQEVSRLNIYTSQLVAAQAEKAAATSVQLGSGTETSVDVQQSAAVQGLRVQLTTLQTKMSEISSIVGANHPQRIALEAQISETRQQLANEMRRVTGGTAAVSKTTERKLVELEALVEQQKARVLSLRSARDDMQVLLRDVESAQRAYDNARQRLSQLNLESQTNQANVRVMSPAIEPLEPSRAKVLKHIVVSLGAGLVLGLAAVFALEFLDRRVRSPEDLLVVEGVPVLGVLKPPGSKAPVFRRLALGGVPVRPALPPVGAQ